MMTRVGIILQTCSYGRTLSGMRSVALAISHTPFNVTLHRISILILCITILSTTEVLILCL